MKGTGLAFFLTAWMAGVLAVSYAKNDLMSGLDDHNAEEICFSMAPVRAVTRAATGFSNFPTVQPLCKPRARKNDSAALIFLSLVQTLCKPQARKNDSGNAGRPLCVADPHIPREGQPQ